VDKPDTYLLSQVDWQFWVTLSFKSDAVSSEKLRQSLWFALLRDLAGWWRVDFKRLLWLRRAERGELSARLHWHALLGGLPDSAISRPTCFAIKNDWERLGGGMARVFVYDSARNALDYMLKRELGCESSKKLKEGRPVSMTEGGRQYESQKFGLADSVTYSEGLIRLLDRRRGCSRKTASQTRLRVWHLKSETQTNQVVDGGSFTTSLLRKEANGCSHGQRRQALPE